MTTSYIIGLIFTPLAIILLVPVFVLALECAVAALAPDRKRTPKTETGRPKVSVIIPAHNEEAVIGQTLDLINSQLMAHDQLIVVADNCQDRTAKIARDHKATVIERLDTERRGKGYALEAGLRSLDENDQEVVIFIDADCAVQDNSIDILSRFAVEWNAPVQAQYFMQTQEGADIRQQVSQFAWLLKNHVRPTGLMFLNLPCQLMGTGMAFPWSIIKQAPLGTGNIVEDLQLGIDLAIAGHAPKYCPEAKVTSWFPLSGEAGASQRKRWEHGHLQSIMDHAPRLLAKGIWRLDIRLIVLAFDLSVPPLSLLAMLLAIGVATGLVIAAFGGPTAPVSLMLSGIFIFFCAVLISWSRFARDIFSWRDFLSVPGYILRKATLYISFLTRRQKSWVRTDRSEGDKQ